ncbi:hypothetical protein [Spartinivicinus marinus]|nr:hypothetical protein [Spartinivicinus marinus]MCX4030477.1 hypothetical protein [Spartinivicinus marinus]
MAANPTFEHVLIQEIRYQDKPLDLSWLIEAVYIETLDLSGPKLILKLNDREAIFRDDLGIRPFETLTVTLADPYRRDELDTIEHFVILTMPMDAESVLTLNCLSEVIFQLKMPATQARFFVGEAPETVVKFLVNHTAINTSAFPAIEDYHLLPGMRPSRLLKQIARETAAVIHYQRQQFTFKPISALLKKTALISYHYDDARQQNQILSFKKTNADPLIQSFTQRQFTGWHLAQGILNSSNANTTDSSTVPRELAGFKSPITLANLNTLLTPTLEFTCLGNGALQAGITLQLAFNRNHTELPIDESLPDKVIIQSVAHRYSAQKYQCRVKTCLPLNNEQYH